jgi:hypothetical protein
MCGFRAANAVYKELQGKKALTSIRSGGKNRLSLIATITF